MERGRLPLTYSPWMGPSFVLCPTSSLAEIITHKMASSSVEEDTKKAQAEIAATCDTFSDGKWKKTHTLGRKRKNAPSWASAQGVLIMVGG